MNLGAIREQFITRSGRYDLVSEDGADNGADFFINAGVRYLDRRSNITQASEGFSLVSVDADSQFVQVPKCWLIYSVEVLHPSKDYWVPLHKLHIRGSMNRVMGRRMGELAGYVETLTRHAPSLERIDVLSKDIPGDVVSHADWAYDTTTLELVGRPQTDVVVKVFGKFFSEELVDDEHYNYWSLSHPDILIKAALYQLETFYRNSEGAKDWAISIQQDLTDIEQVEIMRDIYGIDQMRG